MFLYSDYKMEQSVNPDVKFIAKHEKGHKL